MDKEKDLGTEVNDAKADFEPVELTDCNVPINCPNGIDPSEDWFPNHH